MNRSESMEDPTQRGKSFAQRGIDFFPKGMDFTQVVRIGDMPIFSKKKSLQYA
jgi:hypothetical protein